MTLVGFASDHDTVLLNVVVDLGDGVDEAGVSEGEVLLEGELPVFSAGRGHDFFETRVDDVDLVGTLQLVDLVAEAHDLEQASLGLDLVLLGETAWSNVVEVLKPFEVRAGDTTAVDEHVRGGDDAAAGEDLFGSVGRGAIGTLEDGLDLDGLSVALVKRLLDGGGDQNVSLLNQEGKRVLRDGLSCSGE